MKLPAIQVWEGSREGSKVPLPCQSKTKPLPRRYAKLIAGADGRDAGRVSEYVTHLVAEGVVKVLHCEAQVGVARAGGADARPGIRTVEVDRGRDRRGVHPLGDGRHAGDVECTFCDPGQQPLPAGQVKNRCAGQCSRLGSE